MGRSLLAALAFAGLGCAPPALVVQPAPPASPQCPEPPPAQAPVSAPAPPSEEPAPSEVSSLPEGDLEWGYIEPEDLQPRAFDEIRITVTPFETEASDGSLALVSKVTVADVQGTIATFEHPVDTGFCGAEVSTHVEVVATRTLSETIFDAQVTCSVGESHPRWNTGHTVFHVDADRRSATLLVHAEAGSWVVLEESQDVRELDFFLEADTLAMYEERSVWCDADVVFDAHGVRERDCKVSARTLTLKQRIALD